MMMMMTMMMMMMKEYCLYARGILVCMTVVADKTRGSRVRQQGRLVCGCLLVRARFREYHSESWKSSGR
jgi:hypothetical protein